MGAATSRIQFPGRSTRPSSKKVGQQRFYCLYYNKFLRRNKMIDDGDNAMAMIDRNQSHDSTRSDRCLLGQSSNHPVASVSSQASSLPNNDYRLEEETIKQGHELKNQFFQISSNNNNNNGDDHKDGDDDQEEQGTRFARSPSFKVYVSNGTRSRINSKREDEKQSRSQSRSDDNSNDFTQSSKSFVELDNVVPTTFSGSIQGESTNSSDKAIWSRFRSIVPKSRPIPLKNMFISVMSCYNSNNHSINSRSNCKINKPIHMSS